MFKCRICGEKYDHDKMASENDVSICKWCAGDAGYTDRLWSEASMKGFVKQQKGKPYPGR